LTLAHFDDLPESLGAMPSLQRIEIFSCTNTMSLPNSLLIVACPMLEKAMQERNREDWQKIAHVPDLELTAEKIYFSNLLNPLLFSSVTLDLKLYRLHITNIFSYIESLLFSQIIISVYVFVSVSYPISMSVS
jgi:hypothetical protein